MRLRRPFLAAIGAALAVSTLSAQDAAAPVTFDDLGLTITPPPLENLVHDGKQRGQIRARWSGKLGASEVDVLLYVLPTKEFHFVEPEDVTDVLLENLRDPKRGDAAFGWEEIDLVAGPYGWTPYASLAFGPSLEGGQSVGRLFVMASLLPQAGYTVEIDVRPDPGEAGRKTLLDALKKAVQYGGAVREWKWTDAEARERWQKEAPEATHKKLDPPLRTEHYLILTCSSGGKAFAKKMEECYAAIRKIYPFDEVPGRRLMPVFLFRTPEEYYDFCKIVAGWERAEAAATKGHAWKDYYATWYEAPNDPVHIHEATHQIFSNRLRLSGGGSWFQEGVAEYVSTSKNDRNMAASAVKKGRHVPLLEFVQVKSLIAGRGKDADASGEDSAGSNYEQAAVLIEFLRESKWSKGTFDAWFRAVGLTPYNNVSAIEAATKRTLGVGLAEVEKLWVEYCKKR